MSYIDAGYAVALGVVAVYGALLWLRRRRLERLASALSSPPVDRDRPSPT